MVSSCVDSLFPNVVEDLSFEVVVHIPWDNLHQQMGTPLSVPKVWNVQKLSKIVIITHPPNESSDDS